MYNRREQPIIHNSQVENVKGVSNPEPSTISTAENNVELTSVEA
jgi:hypothetical protein